jgi:ABC-type transport system involved in cytochrome c biogenesis permease subunit
VGGMWENNMTFESAMLTGGIISLGLSLVFFIWGWVAAGKIAAGTDQGEKAKAVIPPSARVPNYLNLAMLIIGLICITLSLTDRAIETGHGPFSNMYEFAAAFSWGVIVMGLIFRWRYKMPVISAVGTVIALGLLLFARTLPSQSAPLVPALQQSLLLTTHVASAVISYGAFTIGFISAILFLIKGNAGTESERLDEISYHSVLVGFPFMTLLIILGALWADVAWGKYWSWDPKETASLVTWLLYAAYLHARVMRGWRGRRAALLLIIGFAAVLLTFFGNYIFSGLHAYQ